MNYFDLHCDTPYRMYGEKQGFDKNELHVSLERASYFGHYAQLAAYCSSRKRTDEEAFEKYIRVNDYFCRELERLSDRVKVCLDFADLEGAEISGKVAIFHMVEDARILAGDLSRLDFLYERGCRFLTLVWGQTSCIGGAHDTSEGLTDFGKLVARKCFEIGMVPDISHSSEQSVDDLAVIALEENKPFIASHSNSYEVYGHSRNLRDRHLDTLIELGGLVGVSMCDSHIKPKSDGRPGVDDVIRHIEHYLERGAENCIAFGCDFDGCDLPDGIESVSDIYKVPERMARLNYSEELIKKLCYENARNFIKNNLVK